MWSFFSARPADSLSLWRITFFPIAILLALLVSVVVNTPTVKAADIIEIDRKATWSDNNIEYNGWTLKEATPERNMPSVSDTVCQNNNNIYFSDINRAESEPGKSIILLACLDEGTDENDRSKPGTMQLIIYRAAEGTTSASQFKPSVPTEVEISPLGTDELGRSTTSSEQQSSCDNSKLHGIGWIVCPISYALAEGMDWIFDELVNFFTVPAISTDHSSPLFKAWSMMRNISNVAFVIAFLIIIYSHLTSFGVSNYGMKRLLPRIIIAAIVVNLSYWITAVAVDLSNILGVALEDLFTTMRGSLSATGDEQLHIGWSEVAKFILAGTIAGSVGLVSLGISSMGGMIGGAFIMLLPILLGAVLSVLVALLILAARQALITVLIIISPLAFVAYLLPNTEKYFNKWRDLFMTMLLLFPIFSLLFGGAQLAGYAIILNSGSKISLVILGMAVQVIPLAITPFLIRFSGSLLGQIGSVANRYNQQLVSKTKGHTDTMAAAARARGTWRTNENGEYGNTTQWRGSDGRIRPRFSTASLGRRMNRGRRAREERQKAYDAYGEADYAMSGAHRDIHSRVELANLRKTMGDEQAKEHFNEQVQERSPYRRVYFESRDAKDRADNATKRSESMFENVKTDPGLAPADIAAGGLAERIKRNADDQRSLDHRLESAKRVQASNYYDDITKDSEMRDYAGNIDVDPMFGNQRMDAIGQQTISKARQERIDAATAVYNRQEIKVEDLVRIASGKQARDKKFHGYENNIDSRTAAIRLLGDTGPRSAVLKAMTQIDKSYEATGDDAVARSELAGALAKKKPFILPMSVLNNMAEGRLEPYYNHKSGQNLMALETVNGFALDAEAMVTADRDDLNAIIDMFNSSENAHVSDEAKKQIESSLEAAFNPDGRFANRMGKRRIELNKIRVHFGLDPVYSEEDIV